MNATLVDVDRQPKPKQRKERERIQFVEAGPRDEWFQQTTDERGRPIWFLRLNITGLRTRRYGPFATKRRALLFLDQLLDLVGDGLNEAVNRLQPYQVPARQFSYRGDHYPIVEDELVDAGQ